MAKVVEGHRRYIRFKKTILLNRKRRDYWSFWTCMTTRHSHGISLQYMSRRFMREEGWGNQHIGK
ncbi:unnamed protein product [Brassica rapa subsp. narinosa]